MCGFLRGDENRQRDEQLDSGERGLRSRGHPFAGVGRVLEGRIRVFLSGGSGHIWNGTALQGRP
jgi:hypothetical protein